MARGIPDERLGELAADRAAGVPIKELLAKYGCGVEALYGAIRRAGLPTLPKPRKVEGLKADIVSRYLDAKQPPAQIGVDLGISEMAVYNALRRWGVLQDRWERTKSDATHSYFDGIGVEEGPTYFAGLIAGDGTLDSRDGNKCRIRLSLHERDADAVEAFAREVNVAVRRWTQPARPIEVGRTLPKSPTVGVTVFSRPIFDALVSHGITPRKSRTIRVSDALVNSRHFWRGYWDANGSVSPSVPGQRYSYPNTTLSTGSAALAEQAAAFIRQTVPEWAGGVKVIEPSAGRMGVSPYYEIRVRGRSTCPPLISHLYSDCRFAMRRKREAAERIITQWRPRS